MRFKVDHDLHIHSQLSRCSRHPEQTPENILKYAKDNNLSCIVITDHYWDSAVDGASPWYQTQNFEHISKSKPLPQCEGVKFLFGCETEMDKYGRLGLPIERFDDFDFVIIPTTHLHMTNFTIDEADKIEHQSIADAWVKRLDTLLNMELPFHKIGIAHLACELMDKRSREDYLKLLNCIPTDEMIRLFTKAAKLGVGIEINQGDMMFKEHESDTMLRMFRIAKECGCKFYLGSDAHSPEGFLKTIAVFEHAVDMLDLKESDKFRITT